MKAQGSQAMMQIVKYSLTLGLLATAGWATSAKAENLTLACLVDTPAYDQYTEGACVGYIPSGPMQTTAVFEVFGQDAGVNYSYAWSDANCTSNYKVCITNIGRNRTKTVRVNVTNHSTGVTRTLTAIAEYIW
jgi:hypothetical protein